MPNHDGLGSITSKESIITEKKEMKKTELLQMYYEIKNVIFTSLEEDEDFQKNFILGEEELD